MVAAVAITVIGLVVSGWALGLRLSNAHNGLLALSFTGVGLYVVRVRPGHLEGRLLVSVGVVHAVMFFGRQYGSSDGSLPAQEWIAWLGVWLLPLAIALAGLTLMAFPDGRLLSRGWRVSAIAMMAVAAALSAVSAAWPVNHDDPGRLVSHPFNLPGARGAASFWNGAQVSFVVFQVLWTAAVVARLRRASGDEVRQMRWLVFAVVVDLALLVGGLVVTGSPLPGLLALPLIPVAAGVAIVKYRLYDIDPVINKTIAIGAMVLVITAGYVAVVLGVGTLLPAGRGVLWLVTTAAVAVAAEPLRRRAQQFADRIVYGHRTTPYEALAELTDRIHSAPEALLEGVATTVANAVGAREVIVWVGSEARLVPAAAWPANVERTARALEDLDRSGLHVRPVAHRGTVLGALAVRKSGEWLTASEERLVSDLAAQTALIVLQQRHADDLRAAARRIVMAEDAARRRIERDLHDGAQQRLVTLGLELGALVERSRADPVLAACVSEVRAQLLDATSELRELARGLHPMVLTEQGLAAALETLADRSPVPVKLSVSLHDRLPRDIEATAYFLVSEALTNAARHAEARSVSVSVTKVDGGLRLEVADDGRGGAIRTEGGGLQGLADRLAAIGAQLQVDSPAGAGTRISAVLPCA